MTTYRALTKAFIKSLHMSESRDKRTRNTMKVIVAIVVLFIFIPVAVFCAMMTYALCDSMKFFNLVDIGVAMMLHLICLFTIFFGFNVIFSEFYFSSDLEFVRPWPVKASQVVAAKFSVSYYVDNAMQIFMVIASLAGFFASVKPGVLSYLSGAVAVLTLPVLPLSYCGIIAMLIMRFTKRVKNRESVQKITAGALALFILIFIILFRSLAKNEDEMVAFFLNETGSPFVSKLNLIFPTVHFISKAITYGSVSDLLIYVFINVIAVAFMLFVSEGIYFKGFENLSRNIKGKQRSYEELMKISVIKSPFKAYLRKEFLILFRTPAFFTNCILPNFIWPVFAFIILKMQVYDVSLTALRIYNMNRPKTVAFFLISGSVVFSLIITALNSLASNAISREGKHFQFMKYIPVRYGLQWDMKVLVSCILSFTGIWIYLLPACILLQINPLYIVVSLALSILSITFVSYMGVYIDSIQPKLVWDDELSVLRENTNVALTMALTLGLAVAIGAAGYSFYAFLRVRLLLVSLALFLVLGLLNLFILWRTAKNASRRIATQEEM